MKIFTTKYSGPKVKIKGINKTLLLLLFFTFMSTVVYSQQANKGVTKTVSNATPNVGSNVTFTITATNSGPNTDSNVVVNDKLPTGYTFVSATPSVGTYNSSTGIWTIGVMINGATQTLTIVATVKPKGSYTNRATIKGVLNDPIASNDVASVTPVPVKQTDLRITKTVNVSSPNVGTNVVFTLAASNLGPSDASGIVVTDLLPTGYTFVSYTSTAGIYNSVTGPWSDFNNDTLTPNIVVNQDTWVKLTLNNGISSCLSSDIMFIDAIPRATAGTGTTRIYSVNSSIVTLSSLLTGADIGGTWSLVSGSPGIGSYDLSTGTINPGTAGAGTYVFRYSVTGTSPCPVSTADVTVVITPSTDLSITKTVSNSSPIFGSNVTFTITATNNGLSPASGVSVTDLLPSGYTFVSATPSTGSYISGTGIWTIGAMANAATATLTIVATVNTTGVYTNVATISGTENDPALSNNTASAMPVPVDPCDANVVPNIN